MIGRLGSVEELLAAPVEHLIEVQQVVERVHRPGSGGVMPFCPIADGRVVLDHPLRALATGAAADVPLVIGTNAHETTLFLWPKPTRASAPTHMAGRSRTTSWQRGSGATPGDHTKSS